jgi:hypothetical protein
MGGVATVTRQDVDRVKLRDLDFPDHQDTLLARMRAVVEAQQAVATHESVLA